MENNEKSSKKIKSNCECCEYYSYDDDVEAYVCTLNLDMDEMEHFVTGETRNCPYFRFFDEYKLVEKQI